MQSGFCLVLLTINNEYMIECITNSCSFCLITMMNTLGNNNKAACKTSNPMNPPISLALRIDNSVLSGDQSPIHNYKHSYQRCNPFSQSFQGCLVYSQIAMAPLTCTLRNRITASCGICRHSSSFM